MTAAGVEGFPAEAPLREQFFHTWSNWVHPAMFNPEKRRALAQLGVSEKITEATKVAGHKTVADIGQLVERSRAHGTMHNVPIELILSNMNSVVETTMDFMVFDQFISAENGENIDRMFSRK